MHLGPRNADVANSQHSHRQYAGCDRFQPLLLLDSIVGIITTVLFLTLTAYLAAGCASLGLTSVDKQAEKEARLMQAELSLAKEYLDRGEANLAWTNLRPLYQRAPRQPAVLNLVGLTHLALENYQSAISVLQKAYTLHPTAVSGLNLSSAYLATGQYEKARLLLQNLLSKYPRYEYRERLWHNMALTYEHEQRWHEAVRTYELAIKTNPNFTLSFLRSAALYTRLHQEQRGLHYYSKALRLCPSCYEAVASIASHHLQQGQIAAAIKLLQAYTKQKNTPRKDRKDALNLLSLAENLKARQNKETRH